MSLTANRRDLADALDRLQGICARNASMPALAHVLLQVEGHRLRLTTTDLEVTLTAAIGVEVEAEFQACVPAKILATTVARLDGERVSLDWTQDNVLELHAGKSQHELRGLTADAYPRVPTKQPDQEIDPAPLLAVLDRTEYAVSRERARPGMCGMRLHVADGMLHGAATDGHRLSMTAREFAAPDIGPIVVPRPALGVLRRLISDHGGEGAWWSLADHLSVTVGAWTVHVRLLDVEFPAVEQVVPEPQDAGVRLERKALLDQLRLTRIVAELRGGRVTVEADGGMAHFAAKNEDVGSFAGDCPCEVAQSLSADFNVAYLQDAVRIAESDHVRLHCADSRTPALIVDEDHPDDVLVVMPMAKP